MEQLIAAQEELCGRIARTHENLKKQGAAKITTDLVESTLKLLDHKWEKFENQHDQLRKDYWTELKSHDYIKLNLVTRIEDIYLEQRAALMEVKRAIEAHVAAATASRNDSLHSESKHNLSVSTLPKINLPHFSGRYEEWPAFRDLFASLIGKQEMLSNVEKLHYLKSSVSGSAMQLIQSLAVTEDNFPRAWATLSHHFENKRLLVRSCLSSFTSLSKMKTESAQDLRKIFNSMLTTVNSLDGMGRPLAGNMDLFVHLVVDLLDGRTRREWENAVGGSTQPPSYDELRTFLERKLHTLDALSPSKAEFSGLGRGEGSSKTVRALLAKSHDETRRRCPLCSKHHFIMFCDIFKKTSAEQRKETVHKLNLCFNCLGRHMASACGSTKTCAHCSARHHTLLHDAWVPEKSDTKQTASWVTSHLVHHVAENHRSVTLATARVQVADRHGTFRIARALVDPGSDVSLVAESLVQRLELKRFAASVAVLGVADMKTGNTRGQVLLSIASRFGFSEEKVSAIILPKVTSYGQDCSTSKRSWSFLDGLELADPDFLGPGRVEILLGADIFPRIALEGLRKGGPSEPMAQRTTLGWIILDPTGEASLGPTVTSLQCSLDAELSVSVRRFWEQEEPAPCSPLLSAAEAKCMEHYATTHSRQEDGRYVVRLPFIADPSDFSESRKAALRMLHSTEQRFRRDASFRQMYSDFMREYEELGHMTSVPREESEARLGCFLPHHGVMREASSSTKLRVVFNGSWKASEGRSLNDFLMVGPNLIPKLADTLLAWRQHQYVFVTDIEKMYRQIEVHESDRDWQRILWRRGEAVVEFRLNTVTYGLAAAPFLAVRTLHQLAEDEGHRFPVGAAILRENVYVDDVLAGASSVPEAFERRRQLEEICSKGKFPLKKWAANRTTLLDGIPTENRATKGALTWRSDECLSTLGLEWRPGDDDFTFTLRPFEDSASTKRGILSQAAQLFDPLGWMAPVTIRAKCIIQSTWMRHIGWDDKLPEEDVTAWAVFVEELPLLHNIHIPRWLGMMPHTEVLEIHGFADASERAYAAVVYLRTQAAGEIRLSLLQAKTRVAPLKQVSLPRLELCAASLLVTVVAHTLKVLKLTTSNVHLWSDSMVTLGWIQGHPCKWTTYVANRVAEIQRALPDALWHHIPGKYNPADCASRGIAPSALAAHSLWWHEPEFLQDPHWKPFPMKEFRSDLPEQRKVVHLAEAVVRESEVLTRFSSLNRLLRVTAWMKRWRKTCGLSVSRSQPLKAEELEEAETGWIRHVQTVAYSEELQLLNKGKPLPGRSSLLALTPFRDKSGILRVGGRIKHALLGYDERHPIILPSQSHLASLLVDACHRRALHGGVQLTLSLIRRRFWLQKGRQMVRRHIHRCTPPCAMAGGISSAIDE